MPREDAMTKGRRLLGEGRLYVVRVQREPFEVVAYCRGDHGLVYQCKFLGGQWGCECEARSEDCSHLRALRLVTVRPRQEAA